jgi:co-chaperonin GroES (HSP10)
MWRALLVQHRTGILEIVSTVDQQHADSNLALQVVTTACNADGAAGRPCACEASGARNGAPHCTNHVRAAILLPFKRLSSIQTTACSGCKFDLCWSVIAQNRRLQVSKGGVLLASPKSGALDDAQVGEVLDVGQKVEIKVSKGDTIVYTKQGTVDVEASDGKVVFLYADSVLGVCA